MRVTVTFRVLSWRPGPSLTSLSPWVRSAYTGAGVGGRGHAQWSRLCLGCGSLGRVRAGATSAVRELPLWACPVTSTTPPAARHPARSREDRVLRWRAGSRRGPPPRPVQSATVGVPSSPPRLLRQRVPTRAPAVSSRLSQAHGPGESCCRPGAPLAHCAPYGVTWVGPQHARGLGSTQHRARHAVGAQ